MFLGGGVNVRESGEGGVDALHCLLPALPLAQALGGAQAVGSRLKIFDGFRNKYSLPSTLCHTCKGFLIGA